MASFSSPIFSRRSWTCGMILRIDLSWNVSSYPTGRLGKLSRSFGELVQRSVDDRRLLFGLVLGSLDDVLRGFQGGHQGAVYWHVDGDKRLLNLNQRMKPRNPRKSKANKPDPEPCLWCQRPSVDSHWLCQSYSSQVLPRTQLFHSWSPSC